MIDHINLLKCREPTFVPGLKIIHFLDVFIRLTDKTPLNSIERTPSLIEKISGPRIQTHIDLLTSDYITTPKLYVSPIFFPSSPYFPSLHVTLSRS